MNNNNSFKSNLINNILKSYLAGILIALGSLLYMIFAPEGVGFKIVGAFLFSVGLYSILDERLTLVTGTFNKLYNSEWNLREILLVFFMNFLGVLTIYFIRALDSYPEAARQCAELIVNARDSKLWYQHILAGIGCGACI